MITVHQTQFFLLFCIFLAVLPPSSTVLGSREATLQWALTHQTPRQGSQKDQEAAFVLRWTHRKIYGPCGALDLPPSTLCVGAPYITNLNQVRRGFQHR